MMTTFFKFSRRLRPPPPLASHPPPEWVWTSAVGPLPGPDCSSSQLEPQDCSWGDAAPCWSNHQVQLLEPVSLHTLSSFD